MKKQKTVPAWLSTLFVSGLSLFSAGVLSAEDVSWQGPGNYEVLPGSEVTVTGEAVAGTGDVTIRISGGKVTSSTAVQWGKTHNLTVDQTGGTVIFPSRQNFIQRESSENSQTIWNLSGTASFYIPQLAGASEFSGQSFVGYNGSGTLNIGLESGTSNASESSSSITSSNSSPIFYSRILGLGWTLQGHWAVLHSMDGLGTINQHSGQSYIAQLNMMYRGTTADAQANSYTLNGGEFYAGWIAVRTKGEAQSVRQTAPLLNLNGGTFAAEQIGGSKPNSFSDLEALEVKNQGSSFEIVSDLKKTLDDFNGSIGTSAAPQIDPTSIGTASIYGNYSQTAGQIVLDYAAADSFDQFSVKAYSSKPGNLTLDGGSVLVRTEWGKKITLGESFTPFSAEGTFTVGTDLNVRSSMTGWAWTLDSAGKLTSNVQQAREAARQMQCSNNLKNLGLAALNHESSIRSLPSGGWQWRMVGDSDWGLGQKQPGSWGFSLLPFMEQNALFTLGADGNHTAVPSSQKKAGARQANETPLNIFYCPSRRACKGFYFSHGGATGTNHKNVYNITPPGSEGFLVGKSDYAASAGSKTTWCGAAEMTPAGYPEAQNFDFSITTSTYNGVIYRFSKTTMGEIRGGTSNTYLLGEKYLMVNDYETGTNDTDNEGVFFGGCDDNLRTSYYSSSAPKPAQDRMGYNSAKENFGSPHAGAFGMVMCDGSSHRVSYSIDHQTHAHLSERNRSEPAVLPN